MEASIGNSTPSARSAQSVGASPMRRLVTPGAAERSRGGHPLRNIVSNMVYPASELVIDPALIRKYDLSGPRYTSYPTADRFVEAFGEGCFRQWLEQRGLGGRSHPPSVSLLPPPAVLRHGLLLLRLQQGRDARPRTLRKVYQVPRPGTRAGGRGPGAARGRRAAHLPAALGG